MEKKSEKNYMKDKTFKKMIMIIHINGVSKNRIYLSIFFFLSTLPEFFESLSTICHAPRIPPASRISHVFCLLAARCTDIERAIQYHFSLATGEIIMVIYSPLQD